MVTVLVLGNTLRAVVGESEVAVEVSEPLTVKQLVEANRGRLGGLFRFSDNHEALITVNKKIGTVDSPVRDGDIVKFAFQSRASYDGTRDIPT
jgi:molybdopterin synthase sulfur carrier subunit